MNTVGRGIQNRLFLNDVSNIWSAFDALVKVVHSILPKTFAIRVMKEGGFEIARSTSTKIYNTKEVENFCTTFGSKINELKLTTEKDSNLDQQVQFVLNLVAKHSANSLNSLEIRGVCLEMYCKFLEVLQSN